jgi:hypothetical protein
MGSTVHDVVRDVVTRTAPHELPLVDGLSRLDEDRVVRLLRRRRRDERLGFGLAEVAAVVTPVVWIAVDEASRMGVKVAADGIGGRVRVAARRVFGRRAAGASGPLTVPQLSREQLAAVHERVLIGAGSAGLDGPAAQGLADHVVARLALELPAAPQVREGQS